MIKKRILAFTLAFALLVSALAVPASANIPRNEFLVSDLLGVGDVHDIVLTVAVPTNLDFTLDPFMMTGVGELRDPLQGEQLSQIVEADFEIINNTFAPVAAVFYVDAVLGDDVTLITRTQALSPSADEDYGFAPIDMNFRDRVLHLNVLGADAIDRGTTAFGDVGFDAGTAELTFDSPASSPTTEPFTSFAFDAEEDAYIADFAFVLDAATPGAPGSIVRGSNAPNPSVTATAALRSDITTFDGDTNGWAYDTSNARIIHAASGDTAVVASGSDEWEFTRAEAPPLGIIDEATANVYWTWDSTPILSSIGDGSLASFVFYAEMNTFAPWADEDVNVEAVLWLTPLHRDQVALGGPLAAAATNGHNKFPAEEVPDRLADASVPDGYIGFHRLHGSAPGFSVQNTTEATLIIAETAGQIFIPFAGATTANTTVFNNAGTAITQHFTVTADGLTMTLDRSNLTRNLGAAALEHHVIVIGSARHTLNFE